MEDRSKHRTSPQAPLPDRAERLAMALRANLKRRKAQARGRADSVESPEAEKGEKRPNQPNSSGEGD
jgi:hypothetical protein